MRGDTLPLLRTRVPGPQSEAWVDRLALRECPAITARRARRAAVLGTAKDDPIVWARARGANVEDVDGNIFVDLTSGFGVASLGHSHPAVVRAAREQARTLLHAMGDAFPDPSRIRLLEALTAATGLDRVILGSSGSDAVEAAVKTARMATGRDRVLAFEGGYHGLSYGALAATRYASGLFRAPFEGQLGPHVSWAPFGGPLPDLRDVGAVLVEPIQGRGGVRVPPPGWLKSLVEAAHEAGAVVIFDEIYTGFGRTGAPFRFQTEGVVPDLLCLGKSMANGSPISACVGSEVIMDAWGASRGPALHTQTFLGHPVGCAMALAAMEALPSMLPKGAVASAALIAGFEARGLRWRGVGMMLALELPDPLRASRALMQQGYIALPCGEAATGGEVLAILPPLCLHPRQIAGLLAALDAGLS
jgi:4-aminobutyrate aminotransferase-like enzyme